MKSIALFLFFAFALSFANAGLAEEMNLDTRWQLYNAESKNPWLAVGAAWLVPTLGHAYAGDWVRGLPFLGAEIGGLVLLVSGSNSTSSSGGMSSTSTIGFWLFVGARIWEYVDAYAAAEETNKELKEKLHLGFMFKGNSPVLAFSRTL